MLGHKLYQVAKEDRYDVYGSMRENLQTFAGTQLFDEDRILDEVDVRLEKNVQKALDEVEPDVVVNCAGIVKPLAKDVVETIAVNSLYPHTLSRECSRLGAKLIQISTDCVFSGSKGLYSEESTPDPVDLYGRTKLLGEVTYENHLTVRTSMIGRELGTERNLIEWFLNQSGEVPGFTRSIFSGLTTSALSRIILELAIRDTKSLVHVATEPISKHDLLQLVKNTFGLGKITVVPVPGEAVDRSLLAMKLKSLGIHVPSMREMVRELASENQFYERINENWHRTS
jgi:dTDP-4-dehydrorhamnose reductase